MTALANETSVVAEVATSMVALCALSDTVSVAAETTRLAITVVNEHGEDVDPQRSSGGRGLAGIAERVRILGGTVTSGPTPDGGFRVHAELPYDGVNG